MKAPPGGTPLIRAPRFVTSLLLACIFLLLVVGVSGVKAEDLLRLLGRSRGDLLARALAAYAGSYIFRALRFRTLLAGKAPSLPRLFCVVAVHNLLNQVLPVRTGELSYVVLLRNRFHVASSAGVATLAAARALDALALALFLAAGLLFYGARRSLPTAALYGASAALAVLALGAILFLPAVAAGLLRCAGAVLRLLGLAERPLAERLLSKGGEVPAALESLRTRRRLLPAFLWSLCTWFCIFGTCYLVLLSFSVIDPETLPFGVSIVGTSALNVTSILPLNALGNLGTWEAGWAAGYMLLGLPKRTAFETGFGLHAAVFAFALLLGGAGWLALPPGRRADPGEGPGK